MKAIRSANIGGRNCKQEMFRFCRMYRTTTHASTKATAFSLLFNCDPQTKLPEFNEAGYENQRVKEADSKAKLKMKEYSD